MDTAALLSSSPPSSLPLFFLLFIRCSQCRNAHDIISRGPTGSFPGSLAATEKWARDHYNEQRNGRPPESLGFFGTIKALFSQCGACLAEYRSRAAAVISPRTSPRTQTAGGGSGERAARGRKRQTPNAKRNLPGSKEERAYEEAVIASQIQHSLSGLFRKMSPRGPSPRRPIAFSHYDYESALL